MYIQYLNIIDCVEYGNFMEIHLETCTAPENGDIKNQIGFELDRFLGICWL